MGVSRSGFYASLKRLPSTHMIEDEVLSERIKDIFTEHKGRYGTRRIKVVLENESLTVSRRRIARLLRKQGLYTKGARRKFTRHSKDITHLRGNIVNQNFDIKSKNSVWFGDITYIPTTEGNLYCSVFIDSFTRKCIAYSIKDHMKDSLALQVYTKRSVEKILLRDSLFILIKDHSIQARGFMNL